jgi:hypothetical protein
VATGEPTNGGRPSKTALTSSDPSREESGRQVQSLPALMSKGCYSENMPDSNQRVLRDGCRNLEVWSGSKPGPGLWNELHVESGFTSRLYVLCIGVLAYLT